MTKNFSKKNLDIVNEINKIIDSHKINLTTGQIFNELLKTGKISHWKNPYNHFLKLLNSAKTTKLIDEKRIFRVKNIK